MPGGDEGAVQFASISPRTSPRARRTPAMCRVSRIDPNAASANTAATPPGTPSRCSETNAWTSVISRTGSEISSQISRTCGSASRTSSLVCGGRAIGTGRVLSATRASGCSRIDSAKSMVLAASDQAASRSATPSRAAAGAVDRAAASAGTPPRAACSRDASSHAERCRTAARWTAGPATAARGGGGGHPHGQTSFPSGVSADPTRSPTCRASRSAASSASMSYPARTPPGPGARLCWMTWVSSCASRPRPPDVAGAEAPWPKTTCRPTV